MTDNYDSEEYKSLLNKAQRYCARQEQCRSAVRRKLAQWGATPQQIDDIIERLVADGFIDEQRFASLFCHEKLMLQQWGRNRLMWELRAKGVPDTFIRAGIAALNPAEYDSVIDRLALKKWRSLDGYEVYERRQRLSAYLQGRGFTTGEVQQCLPRILPRD